MSAYFRKLEIILGDVGIYEKLLDSILNFFKDIKKNTKFLLPIFIGIGIGVLSFSKILNYLLYQFPIQTKSIFIGLIIGSIPSLLKEAIANRDRFLASLEVKEQKPQEDKKAGFGGEQPSANTTAPKGSTAPDIDDLFGED